MRTPTAARSERAPSDERVVTLHWPAPQDVRDAIAATGRGCLLVVPPGAPPPEPPLLPLEDWIREPVNRIEEELRIRELTRRQQARHHGLVLDGDGLLHVGERWVALSRLEQSLVAPLLTSPNRPVGLDEVRRAYVAAGGTDDLTPLRRALSRLRARLAPLEVRVHLLSGRAVLLEVTT
jgi:hypothetical protein